MHGWRQEKHRRTAHLLVHERQIPRTIVWDTKPVELAIINSCTSYEPIVNWCWLAPARCTCADQLATGLVMFQITAPEPTERTQPWYMNMNPIVHKRGTMTHVFVHGWTVRDVCGHTAHNMHTYAQSAFSYILHIMRLEANACRDVHVFVSFQFSGVLWLFFFLMFLSAVFVSFSDIHMVGCLDPSICVLLPIRLGGWRLLHHLLQRHPLRSRNQRLR